MLCPTTVRVAVLLVVWCWCLQIGAVGGSRWSTRFQAPVKLFLTNGWYCELEVGRPATRKTLRVDLDSDGIYLFNIPRRDSTSYSETAWMRPVSSARGGGGGGAGVIATRADVQDPRNVSLDQDQGQDQAPVDPTYIEAGRTGSELFRFGMYASDPIRMEVIYGLPSDPSLQHLLDRSRQVMPSSSYEGILGLGEGSPLWKHWRGFTLSYGALNLGAMTLEDAGSATSSARDVVFCPLLRDGKGRATPTRVVAYGREAYRLRQGDAAAPLHPRPPSPSGISAAIPDGKEYSLTLDASTEFTHMPDDLYRRSAEERRMYLVSVGCVGGGATDSLDPVDSGAAEDEEEYAPPRFPSASSSSYMMGGTGEAINRVLTFSSSDHRVVDASSGKDVLLLRHNRRASQEEEGEPSAEAGRGGFVDTGPSHDAIVLGRWAMRRVVVVRDYATRRQALAVSFSAFEDEEAEWLLKVTTAIMAVLLGVWMLGAFSVVLVEDSQVHSMLCLKAYLILMALGALLVHAGGIGGKRLFCKVLGSDSVWAYEVLVVGLAVGLLVEVALVWKRFARSDRPFCTKPEIEHYRTAASWYRSLGWNRLFFETEILLVMWLCTLVSGDSRMAMFRSTFVILFLTVVNGAKLWLALVHDCGIRVYTVAAFAMFALSAYVLVAWNLDPFMHHTWHRRSERTLVTLAIMVSGVAFLSAYMFSRLEYIYCNIWCNVCWELYQRVKALHAVLRYRIGEAEAARQREFMRAAAEESSRTCRAPLVPKRPKAGPGRRDPRGGDGGAVTHDEEGGMSGEVPSEVADTVGTDLPGFLEVGEARPHASFVSSTSRVPQPKKHA